MRQIRIKSGTCRGYLTKGKWYDVVGERNNGLVLEIRDDGGDYICVRVNVCAHLRGGSWEVREVKEESMKEHKISDEKLREIYNHHDICDEWKERIKEAVPTFKVDKWKDITDRVTWGVSFDPSCEGAFGRLQGRYDGIIVAEVYDNGIRASSGARVETDGFTHRIFLRGE